ncbi:MAG: helix-turn-helix domain-containing protein [Gammaproteobacteria bacterium]|nr:helix-turn-helix domain-containing protein [Gammaproteobacteria bacterium]
MRRGRIRASCRQCPAKVRCPVGPEGERTSKLPDPVKTVRVASRGESLYRPGESATAFFMVRSGLLKRHGYTAMNHERVYGFYTTAGVVGLEALTRGQYTHFVQALDTTHVCVIDAAGASGLADNRPMIHRRLFQLAHDEWAAAERNALTITSLSATQRVAAFLGETSWQMAELGFSRSAFQLKMPRRDIARYLGLTVETVCRAMSRLVEQGLVEQGPYHVRLPDPDRLEAFAWSASDPTGLAQGAAG